MNRSLLVLGISALLLGTAACSKQEAAGTRGADDVTTTQGTTLEPGTPSDSMTPPPAAPESLPPESTTEPGATPGAPTDTTTPPADTATPPPQ